LREKIIAAQARGHICEGTRGLEHIKFGRRGTRLLCNLTRRQGLNYGGAIGWVPSGLVSLAEQKGVPYVGSSGLKIKAKGI